MGHLTVVFGSQGWMECHTRGQGPVDQNGTGPRAEHQSTGGTLTLLPRSEGGVVDRGDLSGRNSPLTVLVVDRVGALDGLPRAVIDRSDGLLDPRVHLDGDRPVAAPVMAALMGRGHHLLNRRASRPWSGHGVHPADGGQRGTDESVDSTQGAGWVSRGGVTSGRSSSDVPAPGTGPRSLRRRGTTLIGGLEPARQAIVQVAWARDEQRYVSIGLRGLRARR